MLKPEINCIKMGQHNQIQINTKADRKRNAGLRFKSMNPIYLLYVEQGAIYDEQDNFKSLNLFSCLPVFNFWKNCVALQNCALRLCSHVIGQQSDQLVQTRLARSVFMFSRRFRYCAMLRMFRMIHNILETLKLRFATSPQRDGYGNVLHLRVLLSAGKSSRMFYDFLKT